jgi:hypothetical protein
VVAVHVRDEDAAKTERFDRASLQGHLRSLSAIEEEKLAVSLYRHGGQSASESRRSGAGSQEMNPHEGSVYVKTVNCRKKRDLSE